jgi:hypothetical protein
VREEVRRVCRTAPDPVALHRGVAAAALPAAVPFDRRCGLVLMPRLMEIEAADSDVNGMPALARSRSELTARLFFGHYEPRITTAA